VEPPRVEAAPKAASRRLRKAAARAREYLVDGKAALLGRRLLAGRSGAQRATADGGPGAPRALQAGGGVSEGLGRTSAFAKISEVLAHGLLLF